MYVEDDESIRSSLGTIFNKVFKEVVTCIDGNDGITKFEEYTKNSPDYFDAIVSDINMPKLNGLKMLAKIREHDLDIPAILTTAHGETDFLMEAIRVNVAYYALKPINTQELLSNIQKFCLAKHHKKIIHRQEEELHSYIDILNQVAAVAKVDKNNNFIEVNELFCEVSAYSKDELLTKSLLDLTHKDVVTTVYEEIQHSIFKGENWEGVYKSIDKRSNIYYLRLSAIPEFHDVTNEMTGYTILGFIVTEDEKEKRDVMQKVRQNIIEHKLKESELKSKIRQLEVTKRQFEAQKKYQPDVSFIQDSLDKNKTKIVSLLNQVKHYEKEISVLSKKLEKISSQEFAKRQEILDKNQQIQKENSDLKNKIITLQTSLLKFEKKKKV